MPCKTLSLCERPPACSPRHLQPHQQHNVRVHQDVTRSPQLLMSSHAQARTCPLCRARSHFVTPSAVWPASEQQKEDIVGGYVRHLASIDCRHFDFGESRAGRPSQLLGRYSVKHLEMFGTALGLHRPPLLQFWLVDGSSFIVFESIPHCCWPFCHMCKPALRLPALLDCCGRVRLTLSHAQLLPL